MRKIMDIGILLRYYRKLRDLSQFELAEKAEINEKYYSRIERNENNPTYTVLNKIVTALDIKMTQFSIAADGYCHYDYVFFPAEMKSGEFLKEISPRFVAEVLFNSRIHKVYLACSAKMSSMVLLENRKVNLCKNNSNSKYEYTLFTIDYGNVKIIVDLHAINKMFYELYCLSCLSGYHWYGEGKAEVNCEDYKTDYYFPQEKIVVENKTIISSETICKYPINNAKRIEQQFGKLERLLNIGYDVRINFFILSPWTNKIVFSEYFEDTMIKLKKMGAKFFFYYLFYEKDILKVNRARITPSVGYYDIIFNLHK